MSTDSESERPAGQLPPPITIVAHDIGPVGGMERQLVALILGLRRLGHPVSVIARTCELPSGSGVEFHRVRTPGRPFSIAYPAFLLAGTLAVRRHRRGVVQATGAIVLTASARSRFTTSTKSGRRTRAAPQRRSASTPRWRRC